MIYVEKLVTIIQSVAYAQGEIDTSSVSSLVNSIIGIIAQFVVVLVGVLLVVFFYRIVVSIYKVGESPKALQDGKALLFWGTIALFVVVSIWGILSIFTGTFFGVAPGIPQLGR
jgi:hypothetical protein